MKTTLRTFALSLLAILPTLPAFGQVPYQLKYSIPAPPPGAQRYAQFGYSVAVDGGYTVVSAPYVDIGGQDSGVVNVFNSTTGALLFVIPNPSPANDDNFGNSVAISGTRVVVGVREAESAYVYDLSSGTPTVPVTTLNNPTPVAFDGFGNSVAISGTRVVVGVFGDDTGATNAGSAYVYDLSSGTPTVPVATLHNPTPAAGDSFANSVAISGTRVVVGAYQDGTGATDAGSAYVYDLGSGTPTVPVATLHNPGPATSDNFGFSVAISGTRVVVGAIFDDTGALNAGSAYVYDLSSGTPTVPVATLNNPTPDDYDYFGASVAISGTRVVVGADDSNGADFAGSAYVYDLSSGTPTVPVATLNNPSPANHDDFGNSVAISGTRVVVGTRFDDTGAIDAGSAYVYDLSSGTPTVPVATLNSPTQVAGDGFGVGTSVAISGTRVVVGTHADLAGATEVGRAYVYDLSGGTPTVPVATLNNPTPVAFDGFGNSVAISGTRVVVGAPYDDTGATAAGSAYVYDLSSGTPAVPVATLNNPSPAEGDGFAISVAISGTRVVVGVSGDDAGALDAGRAYVYDLSSGTPTVPVATLNNPSPAEGDGFAISVAISGTRVVVGVSGDDAGALDAGRAYVYDLSSGTPTVPVATLNNPSPAEGDGFAISVAISGTRVVVGAWQDDTGATDSGSAYVYDLSSGTPTVPVATLNNPDPAFSDLFGYSVAISGTRVVVGTPSDSTGAASAGSAYVYELSSGTPTVPVATLDKPSPAVGDLFGISVAIDGSTIAIGAPFDDTTAEDQGAAYIFTPETCLIVPAGTTTITSGGTFDCIVIGAGGTLILDGSPIAPAQTVAVSNSPATTSDPILPDPLPSTETIPLAERQVIYGGVLDSGMPGKAPPDRAAFSVNRKGHFAGSIRYQGRSYRLHGKFASPGRLATGRYVAEPLLGATAKPNPANRGRSVYGLLRVLPSGTVRFVGRLRDGTPISSGGRLSDHGRWTKIAGGTLGAAFTGPGYFGGDAATPGVKSVEVRDTVNLPDVPKRFMRVRVRH